MSDATKLISSMVRGQPCLTCEWEAYPIICKASDKMHILAKMLDQFVQGINSKVTFEALLTHEYQAISLTRNMKASCHSLLIHAAHLRATFLFFLT